MEKKARIRNMGRRALTRDVAKGGAANFSGYFPSNKSDKLIPYEGLLERDFIALLEDDPAVIGYDALPPPLAWRDEIDAHATAFNFQYWTSQGGTLVAVKSAQTVKKFDLEPLYGFARAYALKEGYRAFELWTEVEIRAMPRLANADMKIFQTAHDGDEARFEAVCVALRAGGGRMSIGELRDKSRLNADAYRTIIKLVAKGKCVAEDPDQLLDDRAILREGRDAQ